MYTALHGGADIPACCGPVCDLQQMWHERSSTREFAALAQNTYIIRIDLVQLIHQHIVSRLVSTTSGQFSRIATRPSAIAPAVHLRVPCIAMREHWTLKAQVHFAMADMM